MTEKCRFSVRVIGAIMSCALIFLNVGVASELDAFFNPASGTALFVAKDGGSNKNPGTREAPLKNLDKAINKAAAGDTILVAEGSYSGTFDVGFFLCDKPLKFYGGFAGDFSDRDPKTHPTLLQPDNASGGKSRKAIMEFSKNIDGVVVDGFVFDMGQRNSYHPSDGKPEGVATGRLLLPPQKASGQNATVTEACLSVPSAAQGGEMVIHNNAFLNCASFGIQGGLREGAIHILNNVFVSNRMGAIEVYGTCPSRGGPKSMSRCGEVEVGHNTILFSWSRTKDFQDMGYGVRIMTKAGYSIHHNLIGGNIMSGVDHSRFDPDDWIKLDHNVFFVNKQGDLEYSPASNTSLQLQADQFEDLEFASVDGNRNEIPAGLAVDQAYLEGYLSARYAEETDLDRSSPANQWRSILGLSMQGTMSSSVSMYGNRYPVDKALQLFGAAAGVGAQ